MPARLPVAQNFLRLFTARVPAQSAISIQSRSYAQGYGDGKGDPVGEDPNAQGGSSNKKQNAEHPGPAPPSEGKGTGGGPTKAGGTKSPEDASANSGGSRSKEAKETGPSPKLSDRETPGMDFDKLDDAKKAEVEQHNKEFEKGHDRAQAAEDDKVDKKFWSGHGGADKQP